MGAMDLVVIDRIGLEFDTGGLREELGVGRRQRAVRDSFESIVTEALEVAHPKAAYRLAACERGDGHTVMVDGTVLSSRVLWHHLHDVYRVFPFVATCGTELAAWAATKTDMMERFWAHALLDRALTCAHDTLSKHLERRFGLAQTGVMTPGSLDDWPIEQQRPLFGILGPVEDAIGVRLMESLMMDPLHSVSGIVFPTDVEFEECSLCPLENCPKRRKPYDEHLYDTRYGGTLDQ
jgi:hypothetical protein